MITNLTPSTTDVHRTGFLISFSSNPKCVPVTSYEVGWF